MSKHGNASGLRPHTAIPALDGLRTIAIGLVVCSHIGLQHIVPGQFGVTLFFFLSGYLITTLLRREIEGGGRIDFGRFYLRRAVRILPPMYVTIGVLLLLAWAGAIHPVVTAALPYDLLFLSNYLPLSGIPIGLWSLAVEEHFYLGFPILLGLMSRRLSPAHCALVCLALCVAVLAIRIWEVQRLADFHEVSVWTHTRIDSIVFGSILALWNNPVADRGNIIPSQVTGYILAAALLLPTFLLRDEVFRQTLRYTMQGLGLMALFNAAIRDRGWIGAALNNVVVRHVAGWSYTLYLVHSGLLLAFTGRGHDVRPTMAAVAAIAASVIYAIAMRRWVERPLAAWRQRRERAMGAVPAHHAATPPPRIAGAADLRLATRSPDDEALCVTDLSAVTLAPPPSPKS